ncbi:hypothetical protein XPA_009727 [Xanthoria parietina]
MAESNAGDGYHLRRDFTGSTRLNCQHYLWQQELRFNLHPSIPTPVPGNAIADVATGTGVWLLEVAREHPGVELSRVRYQHSPGPAKGNGSLPTSTSQRGASSKNRRPLYAGSSTSFISDWCVS